MPGVPHPAKLNGPYTHLAAVFSNTYYLIKTFFFFCKNHVVLIKDILSTTSPD